MYQSFNYIRYQEILVLVTLHLTFSKQRTKNHEFYVLITIFSTSENTAQARKLEKCNLFYRKARPSSDGHCLSLNVVTSPIIHKCL